MNPKRNKSMQDARLRQRNILPLDTARNEGIFLGMLVRGPKSLTVIQRIGALVIALPILICGVAVLYTFFRELRKPEIYPGDPAGTWDIPTVLIKGVILVAGSVFTLGGLKICRNAIAAPGPNRTHD